MEKIINQIKIKICDTFPVEEMFGFDEDMVVTMNGEIVKKEVRNNQDNTVDLILTFKALDYDIKKRKD